MPGFGPFCQELAHFAWIWAILLGFGPFCSDLGPKGDEALRMGLGGDGRTDGRTDSPCVLHDFVPFGAAAQKVKKMCFFDFLKNMYDFLHFLVKYAPGGDELKQEKN